jgi:hypothetical protein
MKDKELDKTTLKTLGPTPKQFSASEKKVGRMPMREVAHDGKDGSAGGRQGHPAKPSQPLSIRYIED